MDEANIIDAKEWLSYAQLDLGVARAEALIDEASALFFPIAGIGTIGTETAAIVNALNKCVYYNQSMHTNASIK